ncbi:MULTISPECIES: hypothetical protein [unclassified Carboxylicivirga]|uniref:hypothetical protein n=1 Tax=Carboxylicivirga TaxID=1628153 RepID=UPI003D341303
MKSLTPLILFSLFIHQGIFLTLLAQKSKPCYAQADRDSALACYHNYFDQSLKYINGREYKPYHYPTHENPYLNDRQGEGTLYMEGRTYPNKKLLYDIYKDLLIVNPEFYELSNIYIQLKQSEVDSFDISFDHINFRLIHYKEAYENLKAGYYQCIYKSDNTTLLLKHYAIKSSDESLTTYLKKTQRYLFYEGKYHDISKRKQLFKVLHLHKKAVKRECHKIRHSYKNMSESELINLMQFIDNLSLTQ